jgi:hypothetical protein
VKKKIICFDLDNVICITKKNYYLKSKPKKKVIKLKFLQQEVWEDLMEIKLKCYSI